MHRRNELSDIAQLKYEFYFDSQTFEERKKMKKLDKKTSFNVNLDEWKNQLFTSFEWNVLAKAEAPICFISLRL